MNVEKNKIYFLPYHSKRGKRRNDNKPHAVVDTKHGYMTLNASSIGQLGMERKFMKLYYEPDRNIIDWKVTDKLENDFKDWKMVRVNKAKHFRTYVGGILQEFTKLARSYRAEVHKYVEKGYLEQHDTYYFIRLSKENVYEPVRRSRKVS